MKEHRCPCCGASTQRVIYLGLPGRLCTNWACSCLDGPAAWLPAFASPTDAGPMFAYMAYQGSYWRALWRWLRGL